MTDEEKAMAEEFETDPQLDTFADSLDRDVFSNVDWAKLEDSCKGDREYACSVLQKMHLAFVAAYGSSVIGDDTGWVIAPAVIQPENSDRIYLGVTEHDPALSGERCGTVFLTRYGLLSFSSSNLSSEKRECLQEISSYDYYYTVIMPGDIHMDWENCPLHIRKMIDYCCAAEAELSQEADGGEEMEFD
ncbi:MAG: hypothetical protein LBQ48_05050 [Oscillospiraceae bacterium]|jgi:hypothetical protein|nr:hypothetical protein [Oscillospiraceae bacterium]